MSLISQMNLSRLFSFKPVHLPACSFLIWPRPFVRLSLGLSIQYFICLFVCIFIQLLVCRPVFHLTILNQKYVSYIYIVKLQSDIGASNMAHLRPNYTIQHFYIYILHILSNFRPYQVTISFYSQTLHVLVEIMQ